MNIQGILKTQFNCVVDQLSAVTFDGGVSGTNELFASSASKESTASDTGLTITGTATNFDARGHRLFVLEMR